MPTITLEQELASLGLVKLQELGLISLEGWEASCDYKTHLAGEVFYNTGEMSVSQSKGYENYLFSSKRNKRMGKVVTWYHYKSKEGEYYKSQRNVENITPYPTINVWLEKELSCLASRIAEHGHIRAYLAFLEKSRH